MQTVTIYRGDVADVLPTLDGEFDACFCDPPYGLSFMGKAWDHSVPPPEHWEMVRGLLRPGGWMFAYGGTRVYHWLAVAIEQAGFEIRDQMMWLYAEGFAKALDVSKAIDKKLGEEREQVWAKAHNPKAHGSGLDGREGGTRPSYERAKETGGLTQTDGPEPVSDIAKRFKGYHTALKPCWEPIVVAMKPIEGTYVDNALEHGVAGMDIDSSRIATDEAWDGTEKAEWKGEANALNGGTINEQRSASNPLGRWPGNVLMTHHQDCEPEVNWCVPGCPVAEIDSQSGFSKSASGERKRIGGIWSSEGDGGTQKNHGDSGGASRFFFVSKASSQERHRNLPKGTENHHPTVKPVDLAAYVAKLILPPKRETPRRLLVPYCGSGSEIIGAVRAGWDEIVGIEMQAEFAEIAYHRVSGDNPLFCRATLIDTKEND